MKEYKKRAARFSLKVTKTEIPSAHINTSKNANDYIKKYLYNDDIDVYESSWILLLNRANNVIGFVKISQGGIGGTIIDPRIIAKYAIETLASSIILVHNHPSGRKEPSEEDKVITKKVKETLALFSCSLLDHLIVTSENSYYSFTDEGIL